MLSTYRTLTRSERELIYKLVLCTVIATAFSWLIREPYSPTTAVTANLFLWSDRGYRGSLRYGTRRVLVQIVQGLLVLALIFPCRYWHLPISDSLLIVLSCCIAICIGLPIDFRHPYSPLYCTLANATFLIACATVQNFSAVPLRVLECVAGYLIGYGVNYYLTPQRDRYAEALDRLRWCTEQLIQGEPGAEYPPAKNFVDFNLKCLYEDSEKGLKRHYHTPEALKLLTEFYGLLTAMELHWANKRRYYRAVSAEFQTALETAETECHELHLALIDTLDGTCALPDGMPAAPSLEPRTDSEICLVAGVIDYRARLLDLQAMLMEQAWEQKERIM